MTQLESNHFRCYIHLLNFEGYRPLYALTTSSTVLI